MSSWRTAGLSFVRVANVAAVALRVALKEPHKTAFSSRNKQQAILHVWNNGKPTRTLLSYRQREIDLSMLTRTHAQSSSK